MDMTSSVNSIFSGAAATLALLLMPVSVSAQEPLEQEITVTHHEEVKPTDAVRLNISPAVTMPSMQATRLSYGSRSIKIGVPASIATLAPLSYADTIYVSPFRGYASAAYFPMLNASASAGYKFIDNDRVRLNAWLQFDGESYRGNLPWTETKGDARSVRLRRNTLSLGSALHTAVGRASFLDLGFDYTFARFNTPSDYIGLGTDYGTDPGLRNQNVHRLHVDGLWTMAAGIWNCGFGLGYGHFGYGNGVRSYGKALLEQPVVSFYSMKPMRENKFTVRAFASAKAFGAYSTGMEVNFSYITRGSHLDFLALPDPAAPANMLDGRFYAAGSHNHALLSLRPYYRTSWNKIDLDLGLNLEFAFNSGKVLHLSPAAQATWKPGKFVTVYLKAGGGVRQNTLGSIFDVTYYGLPYMAYRNSNVPLDGEVGVTVGLFRGFYSELSFAYARANGWLMPRLLKGSLTIFDPVDIKGYKAHVGLGYRYRDLIDFNLGLDAAPSKYDKGYYLWRDRAKYVAKASLRVSPLKQLDINLGWDFRAHRRMALTDMPDLVQPDGVVIPGIADGLASMGTVNSLSLGANYRFTSNWTFWANVENLLNHRYTIIGGLPSIGVAGLVGATYKF